MKRIRALVSSLLLTLCAAPLSAAAPDERLAYVAPASPNDHSGIVTVWTPATGQSTAVGGSAGDGSALMWSADGRLAWWTARDHEIGTITVWDGHSVVELSHIALQDDGSPAWSTDGRLAWTDQRSPSLERIVVWDGTTILDLGDGRSPSWSRDGRLTWIGGSGSQQVQLWDGQKMTVFYDSAAIDEGPAWSADGRLAWTVNDKNQYWVKVWDGQTTITTSPTLTTGYALRPVWSADGRLAWTHVGKNRDVDVWDGKTTINVSDSDAADDFPIWSSDGRLAWESRSSAYADVFVWDGQTVTNVSNDPAADDTHPTWSADGRLVWTSEGVDGSGPHLKLWDGKTITNPLGDTLARAPSWSGAWQMPWSHP